MTKTTIRYFRCHPGTAIALIAMFIALGGTSYAALKLPKNSVGSLQIKGGSVGLSDLSKTVRSRLATTGAAGPAGPKGDRGAKGDAGTKGDTGATGPAGPLLHDLPVGETLRGTFGASGTAAAAGEAVRSAQSFAFAVNGNWIAHVLPVGGPPTPDCPGDVDNPQAARGQLCIYPGFSNAALSMQGASTTGAEPNATRYGWIAQIVSTAPGPYQSRGTWAITQG